MKPTALSAVTGLDIYLAGAGPALLVALVVVVGLLLPVLAATVVLVWHGIRRTDPGPASRQLLTLVQMLWTHTPRK